MGQAAEDLLDGSQSDDTGGFVPAYQDNSNTNLIDDHYCFYCEMAWYNCLCSHE